MKLLLTEDAEADLADIWFYTLHAWGETQAEIYSLKLQQRLTGLLESRSLWRKRDEITPGLLSINAEKHDIFFREKQDFVIVSRILHRRRDASRHLDQKT